MIKINKLDTITNLFEGKEIRSVWDSEKEDYYFSVVDVINALTDSKNANHYWIVLKGRLKNEGSELVTNCDQLKLKSHKDNKMYLTDVLDTKGIFRLIESIPSKKAEPFKVWFANLGKERIDEVFDPEITGNRLINYYRFKGYTKDWIKQRLVGMVDRSDLTDIWHECGINDSKEYALLTNEIYKTWSGMKANEYKEFKGIRKESLRDNMTDVELLLTNLGEVTTRDIASSEHPNGFKENMSVAKRGGNVAKVAKELYEKETNTKAISKNNNLNYTYYEYKELEDK